MAPPPLGSEIAGMLFPLEPLWRVSVSPPRTFDTGPFDEEGF
jgi:hypothetical protein